MKRMAASVLSAMLLIAAGLLSAPPASAQQYSTLCISFSDSGVFQGVTLGNDGLTCPPVRPPQPTFPLPPSC